jgi:hypothetical protein
LAIQWIGRLLFVQWIDKNISTPNPSSLRGMRKYFSKLHVSRNSPAFCHQQSDTSQVNQPGKLVNDGRNVKRRMDMLISSIEQLLGLI